MKKKDKAQKAIAYAHRLLNVRPRSEKELKDRLFRKGFDRTTVYSVIPLLKEKNVIDDFRFAKLWIESRMRVSPKGEVLLRKELRDKGVPDGIIEEVLAEKEKDENTLARTLVADKMKTLKSLPKEKARKKIFDFLARRGFDFDVIEDVIKGYVK